MLVAQSCLTFCDLMDCSPPGFSVHGILQARILEWVAIYFSKGSSRPKDWTWTSCIAGRFFTIWATRETLNFYILTFYIKLIYILKKKSVSEALSLRVGAQSDWYVGWGDFLEWWSSFLAARGEGYTHLSKSSECSLRICTFHNW